MGFERILGELNFPDENIESWMDAEIDPLDVFDEDDFWTHIIETATREGRMIEDLPQNVADLIESCEFDSGDLDMKVVGNACYFDCVLADITSDGFMVEAYKLAAAVAFAAQFDAEGEVTFSQGYHETESAMGTNFEATLEVLDGKAETDGSF